MEKPKITQGLPVPPYYMGIDPGVSGAIAMLDNRGNLVTTTKLPTYTIRTGKNRQCIDYPALRDLVAQYQPVQMCLIERVWGQTGQGAVSAFSFGMAYGTTLSVLVQLQIPYQDITPNIWKQKFSILKGSGKDVSITEFNKLFPQSRITVKSHHNIAEAGLIAHLCWQTYK